MKKRIISMLLAAMTAFSFSTVSVLAEDIFSETNENAALSNDNVYQDYIVFWKPENSNERIDQYGFFDFNVATALESDSFRVDSTSTNISIITDQNYGGYVTIEIRDIRYRSDDISTWGYYHKSKKFEANGEAQVQTYTGLNTSNTYCLYITVTGGRKAGTGLITAYAH